MSYGRTLARVTTETTVSRLRRATDEANAGSDWFDFPEKMTFTIHLKDKAVDLQLTRSALMTSNVQITDSSGNHDFQFEVR